MKTLLCPTCQTPIECRSRYERGDRDDYWMRSPCNTCKHNEADMDEFPCVFCTYGR